MLFQSVRLVYGAVSDGKHAISKVIVTSKGQGSSAAGIGSYIAFVVYSLGNSPPVHFFLLLPFPRYAYFRLSHPKTPITQTSYQARGLARGQQ